MKAIPREVCRARELDLRNYNLSKLGLGCLASVLLAGGSMITMMLLGRINRGRTHGWGGGVACLLGGDLITLTFAAAGER